MGHRPYITCLDLATKTGAAHGVAGAKHPILETWDLSEAKERPDKLVLLDSMLERHIADYKPDAIFYEAALPINVLMKIGATEETIQMMRSLIGTVEQACARHGVKVAHWQVQAARRGVMGRGRFKRGEAKKAVMAFCRMLRYDAKNDNEADALIGWLYQSALLNPRTAHLSTPLFARSA
jgi:Holliday junction resolvasome RuvABC endonuclease subunit